MNSYRFFKMYADIDEWKPAKPGAQPKSSNVLDQWILARLNATIEEVTKQADDYKLAHAIQPIFSLIDDKSNWFIRRSRRRFWKSEDDSDKNQAYETLWFVLVRVCQLLAPWAPFISDHLWRELTKGTKMPKSVHLSNWPEASKINQGTITEMADTRTVVEHGLGLRMFSSDTQKQVKVRQPLQSLTYTGSKLPTELENIIADEVNVKEVINAHPEDENRQISLDKEITPALKREGLMREVVRNVQNARKKAGLDVDDRIELALSTDDTETAEAVAEHQDVIKVETLAKTLHTRPTQLDYSEQAKIDGSTLDISIKKL